MEERCKFCSKPFQWLTHAFTHLLFNPLIAIKKVASLSSLGRTTNIYWYMGRMKLWSYRVCVNESRVGPTQLMSISMFSLFHFTMKSHSPCSSQEWLLLHVLHIDLSTQCFYQLPHQFLTLTIIREHSFDVYVELGL